MQDTHTQEYQRNSYKHLHLNYNWEIKAAEMDTLRWITEVTLRDKKCNGVLISMVRFKTLLKAETCESNYRLITLEIDF